MEFNELFRMFLYLLTMRNRTKEYKNFYFGHCLKQNLIFLLILLSHALMVFPTISSLLFNSRWMCHSSIILQQKCFHKHNPHIFVSPHSTHHYHCRRKNFFFSRPTKNLSSSFSMILFNTWLVLSMLYYI